MEKIKYKSLSLVIGSFLLLAVFTGCKVNYSASGASISPETKTIKVGYFVNRAPVVNATLSQDFTNMLMDKMKAQTSLTFVQNNADVSFEGEITGYSTSPVAIQANSPAMFRFMITVRVKFVNVKEPKYNFDQTFSHQADFEASQSFSSVEADLTKQIIEKLTDDIFNRAFSNW